MKIIYKEKLNVNEIVFKLVKLLNVKVNKRTINEQLINHPDYPSLLAIGDCLNQWKITNKSYRIAIEGCEAKKLLFPFLAHLVDDGGRFILVHNIQNGKVCYSDESINKASFDKAEFFGHWDGIALHAVKNCDSGEKDYILNRLRYFLSNMILPVLILLFLASISFRLYSLSIPISTAFFLVFHFIGGVIGMLLLAQTINSQNPLLKKMCGIISKNDCQSILQSDAAYITSWLSWSEIGFLYFAGGFLTILLVPTALSIISWLCVLTLPFTFYSINYQFKLKSWCLMCCVIQAILMLNFVMAISGGIILTKPNLIGNDFFLIIIGYLLPVTIWASIKPYLKSAKQIKLCNSQLRRFKYDPVVFNQLLSFQKRLDIKHDIMSVELGNPKAQSVITMFSSPFCRPCGDSHFFLTDLVKSRDDIKVNVVFNLVDYRDEHRNVIVKHISALGTLEDKKLAAAALDDWYRLGSQQYQFWAQKYPINLNENMKIVLDDHQKWCRIASINATPAFFLNGYQLPDMYRIEDLQYLTI